MGDLNFDILVDRENVKIKVHLEVLDLITEFCDRHKLENEGNEITYQNVGTGAKSRLDFILNNISGYTKSGDLDWTFASSDHAAVTLKLNPPNQGRKAIHLPLA